MNMEHLELVDKVFGYYEKYGNQNYIGEKVTQLEHATQCAMLAEQEGHPEEVILGAFFHDIGHLLPVSADQHMYTDGIQLGVDRHEQRGADYLRTLPLPPVVADLALGHVNAKRYLCFKDLDYHNKLSEASKMTLVHQGGAMTSEEASDFEKQAHFRLCLAARTWDEKAKEQNKSIDPIQKYKDMMKNVLTATCALQK